MKGNKYLIPDKLTGFNLYKETERMVGVEAEITLPNIQFLTAALKGAGIAGEFDSPVLGQTSSIAVDIAFTNLNPVQFELLTYNGMIIARANLECTNMQTHMIENIPVVVYIKGRAKGTDLGKMVMAGTGNSKTTLECTFLKIDLGGETSLEIDKFNNVFNVYGKDVMAGAKKNI